MLQLSAVVCFINVAANVKVFPVERLRKFLFFLVCIPGNVAISHLWASVVQTLYLLLINRLLQKAYLLEESLNVSNIIWFDVWLTSSTLVYLATLPSLTMAFEIVAASIVFLNLSLILTSAFGIANSPH